MLFLSTRQRLGHVDLRIGLHRIAKVPAVLDLPAIYKDHHVGADCALFIEHVPARIRISRENGVQCLPHRRAADNSRRTVDVALDVRGEGYSRHLLQTREREFVCGSAHAFWSVHAV